METSVVHLIGVGGRPAPKGKVSGVLDGGRKGWWGGRDRDGGPGDPEDFTR